MSTRNRERRAAKQRERPGWGGADRAELVETFAEMLRVAAVARLRGERDAPAGCGRRLVTQFGALGRELDLAADRATSAAIGEAWARGWMPSDLHEIARRRVAPALVALLVGAVVVESRGYAAAAVHPRWQAALAALPVEDDPEAGGAHLHRWAERHGRTRAEALAGTVEVLALLGGLPRLEPLLPRPGESRYVPDEKAGAEVDRKALAKVRALLAKAESTSFPEEAEALSAKAQELMSRYSLHQALRDHERGAAPAAAGRRMWLDAPYAGAKALLVQAVSAANRCRAVWLEKLGFVTVVGADADLESVELLTTSLLVQASRAMLAAGPQNSRAGTSRIRSFRQAFLVAYATRIGERLQEASAAGAAEAGEDTGAASSLLPVLAARSEAAEELTARLFPTLTRRTVSVSNGAGWSAGRAAADLARLDVRGSIAG